MAQVNYSRDTQMLFADCLFSRELPRGNSKEVAHIESFAGEQYIF